MRQRRGPGWTTALIAAACALAIVSCGDDEQGSVAGSDYEFDLPADWQDAKDAAGDLAEEAEDAIPAGDLGIQYDSVAADEPVNGFASNVNVIVEGSLAERFDSRRYAAANARLFSDPELARQFLPSNVELLEGPTELAPTEVGGTAAFQFDLDTEFGARRLTQRLTAVVHEGTGYAITFTALADEFDAEAAELEAILESWRWDP